MAKIIPIEGVQRALEVLRVLNLYDELTISALCRLVKMSRAAVNRYVITLVDMGYVYRVENSNVYQVSSKTLELSMGAAAEDWVSLIAYPQMRSLCRQIGWPLSLDVIRGGRLTLLRTTDVESPLVAKGVKAKQSFPIVGTAAGNVLLAYLSEELRREVLKVALADDSALFTKAGLTLASFNEELAEIRRNGYACQRLLRVNWSVIAVPIFSENSVPYSLALRYRTSAHKKPDAVSRFVPKLTATASAIADELLSRGKPAGKRLIANR